MVVTRSHTSAPSAANTQVNLPDILWDLSSSSDDKFREEFNRIRNYYGDDVSNIIAFWLDDKVVPMYRPDKSRTERKILMRLLDYAGLKHPLIRAQLHKYNRAMLDCIGIVLSTRTTAEGDAVKHYRFKTGETL
jgi:hypothetical protein